MPEANVSKKPALRPRYSSHLTADQTRELTGFFFCVVGPSGAGKDSLIDAAREQLPTDSFECATRVITRPPGMPGEIYESSTEHAFIERETAGEFLVTWQAHGLRYALPRTLLNAQCRGKHIIANASRVIATQLSQSVPNVVVIEITAPIAILAERLAKRGRETAEEIRERLTRKVESLPCDLVVHTVHNDLTLDIGVSRFLSLVKTLCEISEPGYGGLYKKIAGYSLNAQEIEKSFDLINTGQVRQGDLEAFLIEYCNHLSDEELYDIAKIRSMSIARLVWPETLVVDKHSLGGTPGNRISMIVIPIVAAYGLMIPKISTRAITSAAGTADAMEVLAKVNLSEREVACVVKQAKGCIAWNGQLNQFTLDTAMNAITRPYNLDTRRWAVASILSKKYCAGATHVVIDIPYAPSAKARDLNEALELVDLFEKVGQALGMTVKAFPTRGDSPIGNGIGPALEARDVMAVLSNHQRAPADLREKALFFAGQILAFDPSIKNADQGYDIATDILRSGRALTQMQKIIKLQGPAKRTIDTASMIVRTIKATRPGRIETIDGHIISAIARCAGAPEQREAGIDMQVRLGDYVKDAQALYDIYATSSDSMNQAVDVANQNSGITITPAPS